MSNPLPAFVFGERLTSHLPERVRRSIAAQQTQSEILIGWGQLLLVLFFGALYTISPKTSAGTGFTPVPWALSIYLVITLVRLWLAYRITLPRWLLIASIIVDIGLLMVLIWSFHIQYRQPPSFYLKAPTLLYVFIFIALRALRFDAVYVLTAGLVAAFGWLCLVLNVVQGEAGHMMITRNYVQYMTSNSILIGAEVDKMVSILVVTLILTVALVRARRLLDRAIVDSTVARDLSRFVSPELADRITSADRELQPGDGEVKEATVLFTDVEGFSTLAEGLEPDELVRALNDYFAAVSAAADRHGGVITQYEGDAMLISFNTITADPDHAANALRTALDIQRVVAERRFGAGLLMKTRCGINTGRFVTGAVGTAERLLYTVHGDEVNIAARLEQLNKQYGTYVLASENTVRAAGDGFPLTRIGEVAVRGRTAPVCVYGLTGMTA